jgi:hypothetical protein
MTTLNDTALFAWDLSVTAAIFGYGLSGLRLLGLRRSSLAVAGVLGVSLWIALGGILNLLHLLRPAVFFTLVASGIVLLAVEILLRRREPKTTPAPFSLLSKLALAAAALLILTLIVGTMRVRSWGVDDIQGYLALGIKTAQTHALQPDPFSQRRVQASMGGGSFLDALMYATGDIRAMNFIDSGFGFGLYVLAVWAAGRRWKVHPIGIAFTLCCLTLLPLVKVNLTIIYIATAGLLALLLLLTDAPEEEPFGTGRVIAIGLIVSTLVATRTPNIVFVLPMLLGVVLLCRLFRTRRSPLLPLCYALLIAVAALVPWCIASKAIAGTYLYPLLGSGDQVCSYHLIWTPAKTGSWQQLVVLAAPNLTFLLLCFAVAWNLTRHWTTAARSAVLAYIGTGVLALPVYLYGAGGEDADRYNAPLVLPIYLLTLLIVLAAPRRLPALWRYAGTLTLLAIGLYNVLFIDIHLMYLFETKSVLYQAFGKLPRHKSPYSFVLDAHDIQSEFAYGAKVQQAIPPGATVLDTSFHTFRYNFRRNPIFTVDNPGMASPPPGLPLDSSSAAQRQFLVDHGVDYLIFEPKDLMSCEYNTVLQLGNADWPHFLKNQRPHFALRDLIADETFTHAYGPWTIVEFFVPCHEHTVFTQIAATSPQVYNDGKLIVARLR